MVPRDGWPSEINIWLQQNMTGDAFGLVFTCLSPKSQSSPNPSPQSKIKNQEYGYDMGCPICVLCICLSIDILQRTALTT